MSTSSPNGPRRPKPSPIRVLVADDHRSFAEALRTAIRVERGLSVVGVTHDGETTIEMAARRRPDVILMDVQMPAIDGITATRQITEEMDGSRVIMLSAFEDEHTVARALDAGAVGFVSKSRPIKDIISAIRAAHRGEPLIDPDQIRRILTQLRRKRALDAADRARVERLTRRETEILQGLARGLSPSRLSEELGISRHTLRTHQQNILFKLKVHSKHEALVLAIRHGKVRTGEAV
ncbi:MAG TPA: response regulator transcription factor [Actinomycetota bacterium]|jgi:DNA-binding NarL/FixJ family response regulator|nr:response regulator transcription factor [Actinomycetota bacterium]